MALESVYPGVVQLLKSKIMNEKEFKLNDCLAFERNLKLDEHFRNHEEWDSMAKIILLGCLEENFNIIISSEQLDKYVTVEEIFNGEK